MPVAGTTPATAPDGADPRSDLELMAAHAAGDAAAFGEVVRRHRDRLWAVALRTLGDREEAADALQEALVSALRASAAGRFRGESAVTTWLHRIVVNACLDRVRRGRVRPTVPLPESDGLAPAATDEIGPRETALVVADALRLLPAEQRAAIVLVDLEGWSVQDAADALGVAAGTVKSRCARGRARLLPLLAGLRETPVPPDGSGRASGNPPRPHDVPPQTAPTLPAAPRKDLP
ncbi:MAG TPA: RNA polymerase sigma factor SigM [Motilibacteraceae bacterium]|nr:RNA polymerase sigma factor SigM [Motilibacteraceae bacterium]